MTAQVGNFGELWSRAFALTMIGGGVMGTPLMLCWCWSKGSTPSVGGAVGVSFAGLVIGAFVGLFLGLPVAIAGVIALRRRPAVWQVYRFAHITGVVVSVGVALLVQASAQLRAAPYLVYLAVAALVGWWLSPRLVHWYVERIDRGLR
ncbi:MAG: hypothetical protein ABMA25_01265 [Ilumatobacteraceae bacterium]